MTAEEAYQWLIDGSTDSRHDAFDVHVVASVLALVISEAKAESRTLAREAGLARTSLLALAVEMFPAAVPRIDDLSANDSLEYDTLDEEEESVRDILGMFASGAGPLERPLAAMIARRCKSPHHLWQDLGLRNRVELSKLMQRHFAPLAAKNRQDMKWKKFLYRMICGSEGFTLCTSPICSECDDFANCFGAEDGESLLARMRNAVGATA